MRQGLPVRLDSAGSKTGFLSVTTASSSTMSPPSSLRSKGITISRILAEKSRSKNPQSVQRSLRKAKLKRFGLSEEDYTKMLVSQNGVCAVCKQPGFKRLAVDHCHKTGKIRGLLCSSCNSAEGLLKSDSTIIRALADYVEYNDKGETNE